MASGYALLQEDLSCPICFEDYNLVVDDKMPKLLLCLHTVCFTCVENLLSVDNILKCPICRTVHEIEEELENLLDNDAIITHIKSQQEHEDKKAALEVYWREWLEKCSDDISDEELQENVQELVNSSLNPIGDQSKSPSKLQRHCRLPAQAQQQLKQLQQEQQIQKQQEQQKLHQKQEQQKLHQKQQSQQERQRHEGQQRQVFEEQRHVQQGQQRQVQQERQRQQQDENYDLRPIIQALNQFFNQLSETINSPHIGEQRNDSFNQLHQELEDDLEYIHVEDTDDEFIYVEGETDDEFEYREEEETEDELDQLEDLGLEQLFVNNNDEQEQLEDEECSDVEDEQEQLEDEEYSDEDDEQEQLEEEECSDVDNEEQQQQQQLNCGNQPNESSSSTQTNVGRKIIVKAFLDQRLNIGHVKNAFSALYGPVDSVATYLGTRKCPCKYAILVFRENVCFINGIYNIDGENLKARLCSGDVGKVFVARLPSWVSDMDIIDYFKPFGDLCDFHRPIHCMSGQPATYCFITFSEHETVDEVLRYREHTLGDDIFIVKPHSRNY